MIRVIMGEVIEQNLSGVVLMTEGGVGYALFVTPNTSASLAVGRNATLHTYLKVAEGALELFGFLHIEERIFFEKLLTVSGVGPKTALNILALGKMQSIQDAIIRGDVKYLTAVQGMGKKTAERLVVELKGKMARTLESSPEGESDALGEVVEALLAMGYEESEAREAANALSGVDGTVTELVKKALQFIR